MEFARRFVGKFDELLIWIGALNSWILVAALTAVPVINTVAVGYLVRAKLVPPLGPNPTMGPEVPRWISWSGGLIAAPILETLFFQVIALFVLRRLLKVNTLISVLVTALAFSFDHRYSITYAAAALISGACYSAVFIAKSYGGQRPFLVVAAGHSGGNGVLLLMVYGLGMFRG